MPLSENEQRILEDIERRLQEEDPRFAQQVARTSLHTHVIRRTRWGALGFMVGFGMLLMFFWSVWVAIGGFAVMLASGLFVYHQLRLMGADQAQAAGGAGRPSLPGFLARLAQRFRGGPPGRG